MVKVCSKCGKEIHSIPLSGGCSLPGYGKDRDGNIVCYDCAGKMDADTLESLKPGEWMDLYLVNDVDGNYWVQNWPGSLKFNIYFPTSANTIFRELGMISGSSSETIGIMVSNTGTTQKLSTFKK